MSFDKEYAKILTKQAYHGIKTKDFNKHDLNKLLNEAAIQIHDNVKNSAKSAKLIKENAQLTQDIAMGYARLYW